MMNLRKDRNVKIGAYSGVTWVDRNGYCPAKRRNLENCRKTSLQNRFTMMQGQNEQL
jgi:hypothetical protein